MKAMNFYTANGVSAESSLKKDLPGIIEFNDKIESGALLLLRQDEERSVSSV